MGANPPIVGRTVPLVPHAFDEIEFDLSARMLAPAFESAPPKLTPRQRERLRSVLRSTLQMADSGGYDAVKMKALSEHGVALATIYRFFGSRDFLIFRATSAWIESVAHSSIPARRTDDFRRASLRQFKRLTAQWALHPGIVEAWSRAVIADDPYIREVQTTMRAAVFAEPQWAPMRSFDPEYALRLRAQIEVHAFGGMVRFAHGQRTLDELNADFAELLELIFDPPLMRG